MWEQIRANRRRSFFFITILMTLLIVMGLVAGEAIRPGAGPLGALIGLGIFFVQYAIYRFGSESILLAGLNAQEVTRDISPQLLNVVEEMKIASGLEVMPRVLLIDSPIPNAFAMGRKPENYTVAVTSGLATRLSRDELQGVVAHEMAHLVNRDVKFMTMASVMLGTIIVMSELIKAMFRHGGRVTRRSSSRGDNGAGAILIVVALLLAVLGPIVAQLLYFAISRKREYLADACGASYTRYPPGLAGALQKISVAGRGLPVSQAAAPLFIINPLSAAGDSDGLFSTHPATSNRINILQSMAGAGWADYDEAFRKVTGKGHVIGDKSLAEAKPIAQRPPMSIIAPVIATIQEEMRASTLIASGMIPVQCVCGMTMNVPQNYPEPTINCMRCGTALEIPKLEPNSAAHREMVAAAVSSPAARLARSNTSAEPKTFQVSSPRKWEVLPCDCGNNIQISPKLSVPNLTCTKCGQRYNIEGAE